MRCRFGSDVCEKGHGREEDSPDGHHVRWAGERKGRKQKKRQ